MIHTDLSSGGKTKNLIKTTSANNKKKHSQITYVKGTHDRIPDGLGRNLRSDISSNRFGTPARPKETKFVPGRADRVFLGHVALNSAVLCVLQSYKVVDSCRDAYWFSRLGPCLGMGDVMMSAVPWRCLSW